MVDKIDPDTIQDAQADMYSDRARRINSLHRSADEIVQAQNKKRLHVSDQINSLTKEQQRLLDEIASVRSDMGPETSTKYTSLVRNLGKTIQNLSIGVKNITLDTARATSSAIQQYGRAVGEDININRQNTVAMALSTATPLFGYFAAKFMETDVFKDSANKLKDTVGGALAGAGRKFAGMFKRKGGEAELEDDDVPKLQTGGYVKKGGVVEVHAAEVVTPIDKLLRKIDQAKNQEIANKLDTVLGTLSTTLSRTQTSLEKFQEDKNTIAVTFSEQFKKSKIQDRKTTTWQEKLLRTMEELKVAMVGTASQLEIKWQRTLLSHPTLRNMMMFGQTMHSVVSAPFKAFFALRGGFSGDARRATRTSNIYQQQVNMLVLIYTKGMAFLRNIEKYSKVTAEALVGEEVSPTADRTYTLFGKIKEFMAQRETKKVPFKEKAFNYFVDSLDLDRATLSDAGINSFTDLMTPSIILKNMGLTRENIREKLELDAAQEQIWNAKFDAEFKARAMAKQAEHFGEKSKDRVVGLWEKISDNIVKLRTLKEAQEEREGPHSPSMAENIASTASSAKEQLNRLSGVVDYLKKTGNKILDWIPMILTWAMGMGKRLGRIGKTLFDIGKAVAIFLGFKSIGAVKKAGGVIGGAATAARAAGVKGTLKGAAKLAGRAVGGVAGLAVGGGMAIWDMAKAMMSGEEEGFVGNFIMRGISGFLGGTESGLAGASHGALKGGALGAGIGSFLPGVGTLIGGAIGTVVGGLLGFIGGGNISKALSYATSTLGDLISGIWKVVKFPFTLLWEGIKSFWVLAKFVTVGLYDMIDEWLSGPGIIGTIWGGIKNLFREWIIEPISKAVSWIGSMFSLDFADLGAEDILNYMKKLFRPITFIVDYYKWLVNKVDTGIESIPLIGSLYKSVKAGTLASDLEKSLEGESLGSLIKSLFTPVVWLWDMYKKMGGWIRDKVSNLFQFIDKDKIMDAVSKMFRPVQAMLDIYEKVKNWVDDRVSSLPLIGRMYKHFKGEDKNPLDDYQTPTPTVPSSALKALSEISPDLDEFVHGKSVNIEKLAERDAEVTKRENRSFWTPMKNLLEKLNEKITDQTEKTLNATNIQTTTIVATSNNNRNQAAYAGGRRGAGPGGYSAGRGVAHKVATANVQ